MIERNERQLDHVKEEDGKNPSNGKEEDRIGGESIGGDRTDG